jgi:hypothetical protein
MVRREGLMKLDAARLCLDCEEIHDSQICPHCSSEAFAYLTRWVRPQIEREVGGTDPHAAERQAGAGRPRTPEQVEAYRQLLEGKPRRRTGLVTGGVLGLAAVSLAGWAIRSSVRKRAAERAEGDVRPEPPTEE